MNQFDFWKQLLTHIAEIYYYTVMEKHNRGYQVVRARGTGSDSSISAVIFYLRYRSFPFLYAISYAFTRPVTISIELYQWYEMRSTKCGKNWV